jgi:transposase
LETENIDINKKLVEKARQGDQQAMYRLYRIYLLEGYKHREIAETLGISESTSKSQYIRAKDLLKEILLNEIAKVRNG